MSDGYEYRNVVIRKQCNPPIVWVGEEMCDDSQAMMPSDVTRGGYELTTNMPMHVVTIPSPNSHADISSNVVLVNCNRIGDTTALVRGGT